MKRSTKIVGVLVATYLVVLFLVAIVFLGSSTEKIVLKIFTAGSLAEPFNGMPDGRDMESLFEEVHANVDVQIQSGGSVEMIRRITELNQTCDVLAVADYSLIPSMMINASVPAASFVIMFAENSMTLAYTDNSRYVDELNQSNWYEILRRADVRFGFSNPNDDPCGYRTMMLLMLAEDYYGDPAIFDDLVMSNTNIENIEISENETTISIPTSLAVTDNSKLMVRSAEVELTSALESGSIDYLFIYESVARRHARSGMKFLELPREINLNDTANADHYQRIMVIQFADSENASKVKTVIGEPIAYGITIPRNAEHPELAAEFVMMMLGETGQEVMRQAGQEPLVPPVAGYWKQQVPDSLRSLVV
ncbi:MAG: tungstate ABC transporter substrate-binding protein WtpA [Thermoplasmata archaeon]